METIKFGFKYFKRNTFAFIVTELMAWVGIYAELLMPLLAGMLVDYVIRSEAVTEESGGVFHFLLSGKYGAVHSMELFFAIVVAYLVLLLIRIVFVYIREMVHEKVGLDLQTELRYDTYRKLMNLDSATIADYNSGELLQILDSDTGMFKQLFSHGIPYLMDAVYILVIVVALLADVNPFFIIIPVILMPVLVRSVNVFRKKARENFKLVRERSAQMNLTTQENIAAVRIIRSFTNEELEEKKFDLANRNFLNARLEGIWLSSKYGVIFNSIRQIAYISTIVIGAVLVIEGYMTMGSILAASTYVTRLMNAITSINNYIFSIQQQTVAGLELKKFLEKESNIPDSGEENLHCDTPNIELKHVSLDIEGQQVLKDINLSIPYGKKVGIVGETGSGKSVLLKTLVRIRDITEGTITVDGHDIKEFGLENLRNMYSYVFQDVFLFSNTIESNIAFSSQKIDQRVVRAAASHAQADSFIDALADRYKTVVGERGLGISGGQKQRVSIARAFHKNAPIFVLDDSTSALDVNTERTLLKDIRENFSEKTVIITAHRFSSVVDCDEIIYMKDGEITERGTFAELMALNGSFARVYNVQQQQAADALACVTNEA